MNKFKRIEGFEDYGISKEGEVFSFKRNKVLCPMVEKNGYKRINLYINGKEHRKSVHRLVAEAFIENKSNLPEVNHKNEDKTDNRVSNLNWVTHKENINHGTGRKRTALNQSKKVIQKKKEGEIVNEFDSIAEAGRNGFNISCVSMCCSGKLKYYKSYIWEYGNN
jgi:hypothetical protein